jgi:hypothetical protein
MASVRGDDGMRRDIIPLRGRGRPMVAAVLTTAAMWRAVEAGMDVEVEVVAGGLEFRYADPRRRLGGPSSASSSSG